MFLKIPIREIESEREAHSPGQPELDLPVRSRIVYQHFGTLEDFNLAGVEVRIHLKGAPPTDFMVNLLQHCVLEIPDNLLRGEPSCAVKK